MNEVDRFSMQHSKFEESLNIFDSLTARTASNLTQLTQLRSQVVEYREDFDKAVLDLQKYVDGISTNVDREVYPPVDVNEASQMSQVQLMSQLDSMIYRYLDSDGQKADELIEHRDKFIEIEDRFIGAFDQMLDEIENRASPVVTSDRVRDFQMVVKASLDEVAQEKAKFKEIEI